MTHIKEWKITLVELNTGQFQIVLSGPGIPEGGQTLSDPMSQERIAAIHGLSHLNEQFETVLNDCYQATQSLWPIDLVTPQTLLEGKVNLLKMRTSGYSPGDILSELKAFLQPEMFFRLAEHIKEQRIKTLEQLSKQYQDFNVGGFEYEKNTTCETTETENVRK